MWEWWLRCCEELGFTPQITQGAWMTLAGGGANASAGYHDGGGCFDLSIKYVSDQQRRRMVVVFRSMGAAYYERYESQGFSLHAHLCLGSDYDIDDGAFAQWQEYLHGPPAGGGDGLMGGAPDYHWRPDPIVTKPPQEDYMGTSDAEKKLDSALKKLDRVLRQGEAQQERHTALRDNVIKPMMALVVDLLAEVKDDATRAQVKRQADLILARLDEVVEDSTDNEEE